MYLSILLPFFSQHWRIYTIVSQSAPTIAKHITAGLMDALLLITALSTRVGGGGVGEGGTGLWQEGNELVNFATNLILVAGGVHRGEEEGGREGGRQARVVWRKALL